MAETINGLYKAEVIHRKGPWRNIQALEIVILEWVDWFNHLRLISTYWSFFSLLLMRPCIIIN